MNLFITGSTGFIGKNLIEELNKIGGYQIYTYDKGDTLEELKSKINEIDFVIHLAGVCKSPRVEDFKEVNVDLTKEIVNIMKTAKKNIPIIFSSSIHAILDTDYGRTKLEAENIIKEEIEESHIFRFHNLFGKYARPNAHSVVATFCYNISHDLEITINDPSVTIEFAYIDEVIKNILDILNGKKSQKEIMYIEKRYKVTIKELADSIYKIKNNEKPQNEFEEKIKETYDYYRNEA